MGRNSKKLELSVAAKQALELGYKQSDSRKYSQRCHIILLKNEGLSSKAIGELLRITDQCVNKWVKRYELSGIKGLETKQGQGRKAILTKEDDENQVRMAIQKERQRLKLAKEEIEKSCGKKFSLSTLKRFLKNLSADGNGFA